MIETSDLIADKQYFNDKLSWLEFNLRVLEEAMDKRHPLLERLKFLAIFQSNLDEFFMIRVADTHKAASAQPSTLAQTELAPSEQLKYIHERVLELSGKAIHYLKNELIPELAEQGLNLLEYHNLNETQKAYLSDYFQQNIFPVLTPLIIDPRHPFPHISNSSLSLGVILFHPEKGQQFVRIKIPPVLPRLVPLEPEPASSPHSKKARATNHAKLAQQFVWLEQVIAANLGRLFEGAQVQSSYTFRVLRDADLEIEEEVEKENNLVEAVEQSLTQRRFGEVVCLSVDQEMPTVLKTLLMANLHVEENELYSLEGPLGLADLMELYAIDRPELKDKPFRPHLPTLLSGPALDIFSVLRNHDLLLHHPYDDFTPVVDFIEAAAEDEQVLAIKQTIYRVGTDSPIIEALVKAAENGKQVTVLVEIKARFDEENNLEWAKTLQRVGAQVVYGTLELKTHAKVGLVIRRESEGLRCYVHLGTGNYNAKTAKIYTDLGLLSSRRELGQDAVTLFNSLTGSVANPNYSKFLVAPVSLQKALLSKIEREIERAKAGDDARLIFKMNALTDLASIDALYRASQAGVKIDLIVRGSCRLVPGVPGLSENIRVISLVGRFLEHSRIYYFYNGGGENSEVYLGSADLMPRNLYRRVETLFPIEDPALRQRIIEDILPAYLKDNQKARQLTPDGNYVRLIPGHEESPFEAQSHFLKAQP